MGDNMLGKIKKTTIITSLTICILLFSLLFTIKTPVVEAQSPPYKITWTILNYYPTTKISAEIQESTIQKDFERWTKYLNVKVVFVKNADPKDVFCTVDFNRKTPLGSGGGDGPNTLCEINISNFKNLYIGPKPPVGKIWWSFESIATHEIGHALGLSHMNCGGCVMMSSYGGLVPQPKEIAALQSIWKNAVCSIPKCLTEPAIVDAKLDLSISDNKFVKGDIANIQWKITNLGNVDYYNAIQVYDLTDRKVLKLNFILVKPSQTVESIINFNTTLSSTGVHVIEGNYITLDADINKINNKVKLNLEILDPSIPVPIPPPTPEPIETVGIDTNNVRIHQN